MFRITKSNTGNVFFIKTLNFITPRTFNYIPTGIRYSLSKRIHLFN